MFKVVITCLSIVMIGAALWGFAVPCSAQDPAELDARVAENPDDVALLVAAGQAWMQAAQSGDGDAVGKAERHLDRALALAPDDPRILVLHGSMLALKGRDAKLPIMKMRHVQKGLKEMDRAVELAPMDFGIRYQRGAFCLNLPDIFERAGTAVEDFSHLLAMAEHAPERVSPTEVAGIKLNLARARMLTGDNDEARALLDAVIQEAPDSQSAEKARALLSKIGT